MKWIVIIAAAGVCMLMLLCIESFRECRHFVVSRYTLEVPQCEPDAKEQTLVFLSDLHNKSYGKANKELIESIKKEKPDLILIGGDMVIGKGVVKDDAALVLTRQLPRIAPVYYANGNHEQRMKECPKSYGTRFRRYRQELSRADVHFLENASAVLRCGGLHLQLSGLELPLYTYGISSSREISEAMLKRRIGAADAKRFQILLAHNPAFFSVYKKWGADLVLSGHLHGGVVRIPGWRGMVTPRLRPFPKYSGEMTVEEGHSIVVSRGLGMHTVHFRLFNRPELVVIHLRPCKNR